MAMVDTDVTPQFISSREGFAPRVTAPGLPYAQNAPFDAAVPVGSGLGLTYQKTAPGGSPLQGLLNALAPPAHHPIFQDVVAGNQLNALARAHARGLFHPALLTALYRGLR